MSPRIESYAGKFEIYDKRVRNTMRQIRNWKSKKRKTMGSIKLRRGHEEIMSKL